MQPKKFQFKPGDLVRLRCFPPIDLGFGANPQSGIIVRKFLKYPNTSLVLHEGREFPIAESGLEVINAG